MSKVCPMSGCQEKVGMCVHDKMFVGIVLVLIVAGGYIFLARKNTPIKNVVKQENQQSVVIETEESEAVVETVNQGVGSYEVYDPVKLVKANDGKVALFFRASWCPSCKALDADIRAHLNEIPANVTILDVDYDKYTDLKKKYGVVMQHTIVQVDADGKEIAKWGGSVTLNDLVREIE
ncbi:MAG: thioredoxin domain-containing protein [Candidatus Moranbacteria bacterium]|nr:thioredoxin domain-containing protein [Candidatus Moranbacteria bacterium]MDD3965246.1 thioredoxin domain-containing protein [Candidatus Moranbacteria bacterium]